MAAKKKSVKKPSPVPDLSRFEGLVKAAKKNPEFIALCDELSLSPSACKSLIEEAIQSGIRLRIRHNHVGTDLEPTHVSKVGVQATSEVKPTFGGVTRVGVISDLHFGSSYCLREQIKDFVNFAYKERGVRTILIPGDVLEGCYRHAAFELDHVGIERQTQDAFETLPQLEGLHYHAITGNHDWTFTDKSGVDVGKYITGFFAQNGREDIHFYGDRGAFVVVDGIVVHLWHPCGGRGYAKSYRPQRQCESYTSIVPQILLIGHWHTYAHVEQRGIEAICCPTFQGGTSPFGKSLGGSPAIGGLILSWEKTKDKILRNFAIERRNYFEVEEPVQVNHPTDAFPVYPRKSRA